MDDPSAERAALLRTYAMREIEKHGEVEGYMAAALDGSLATGAVWPSSDIDFTIVPRPGSLKRHFLETGEHEGIPFHKHLTYRKTLLDIIRGYPDSFIAPAEGEFNPDAVWLLDGLATMEIVDDPEGLLTEVKGFISERQFNDAVMEGRRGAFLQEMRRLLKLARNTLDDDPGEALDMLSDTGGFATVAGQVWLEAAQVIYSSKEQDGRLREAAERLGHPEAHGLYRQVIGVETKCALKAAPLLRVLKDGSMELWDAVIHLYPPDHPSARMLAIERAYAGHVIETMILAPGRGHPASTYQRMRHLRHLVRPYYAASELIQAEIAGAERLKPLLNRVDEQMIFVAEMLTGGLLPETRAKPALQAAEELLQLTERAL